MLVSKQNYYLFLLILLFPLAASAAWSEPTQAPPGGNVPVPVYSTGSGQTIDGTLHVGTPGSYATGLQGTGSTSGIQGNSPDAAIFGNLTNDGAVGDKAVYGLAVDPNDFSASFSGGLGIEMASGDIRFRSRGPGIAWPRLSDEVPLAGLSVTSGGELRVFGHGAGINFLDQNLNSRLTVSEAGAVNVVTGPLTVAGTGVCLSSGANCPAPPPPPPGSSLWLPNGNDIYPNFTGQVQLNNYLRFNSSQAAEQVIDFDPYKDQDPSGYLLIKSGVSPTYGEKKHFRINRDGNIYFGWNTYFGSENSDGVGQMSPSSYKWLIQRDPPKIIARVGGDIDLSNGGDIYLQHNRSIRVDNAGSNTTLLLGNYLGGGDFGYGTNRTASLAVEGDVKGNQLCIKEDCKNSWAGIVQGGGGAYWTLSGNDLFPNNNNYNVGIGNSSPGTYKLNVTGDANATRLCIGGDCKSDWASVATGASGWTDAGATVQLTTAGDTVSLGQTLNSTDLSNFYINGQGNVQIRVDANNNGNNTFALANGSSQQIFVVDESGNTGIGAASFGYPLHVFDNGAGGAGTAIISVDSNDPANYWTGLRLARNSVEKWFVGMDNSTDKLLLRRAGSANDVVIDTGGSVGIGTAAPDYKLHVSAPSDQFAAKIDGNLVVTKSVLVTDQTINKSLIAISDDTQNPELQLAYAAGTNNHWAFYDSQADDSLRIWSPSAGGDKVTILNNGNVGLGTTNPGSYKLSVSGDVAVQGSVFDGLDASNLYINGQGDVQIRVDKDNSGNNRFKINNGTPPSGTTVFSVDEGGAVRDVISYCLGPNCKTTDWGPNSSLPYQTVDIPSPPDAGPPRRVTCGSGYVMVGIEVVSSALSRLVCARMW